MNGEVAYKFFNTLKNGMSLEEVKTSLNLTETEVMGTIELCNIYGYQIDFVAHPTKGYVIKKYLKLRSILCFSEKSFQGNFRESTTIYSRKYSSAVPTYSTSKLRPPRSD